MAHLVKPFRRSLGPLAAGVLVALPTLAVADLSLEPVVTAGLSSPLFVTAPAGDDRLFVVEKGGAIRVVSGGAVLPTPFLSVPANAAGERGLLGMAFDPGFSTNGRFYVDYIDSTTLDTVVARYTVPTPTANVANPTGEIILTVDQPAGRDNHKAGWIGFRPGEANNLYIATGDGGSSNDPDQFAQNVGSNLGKILRIDVSGDGPGYTIPTGNPFAGAIAGNDEIWAYGLRNPFRNSFDRDTGDFYIADVGQGTREEVNYEVTGPTAGRNYGWRAREGAGDNPGVADPPPPNATDPIFNYLRGSSAFSPPGQAASITGGYVYRGDDIAEAVGHYFFADYVTGRIGSFQVVNGVATNVIDRTAELNPTSHGIETFDITSFGEDGDGELYLVDYDGAVYRLIPEPTTAALLALPALARCRRGERRAPSRY